MIKNSGHRGVKSISKQVGRFCLVCGWLSSSLSTSWPVQNPLLSAHLIPMAFFKVQLIFDFFFFLPSVFWQFQSCPPASTFLSDLSWLNCHVMELEEPSRPDLNSSLSTLDHLKNLTVFLWGATHTHSHALFNVMLNIVPGTTVLRNHSLSVSPPVY